MNLCLSLAVIITSVAFAQTPPSTCTTKDYSAKLPPLRNQSGTGWCYAFATADLLSYEVGQPISGLGVAINFLRKGAKETFLQAQGLAGAPSLVAGPLYDVILSTIGGDEFDRGGNAPAALASGISSGPLCLEEQLPQINAGFPELREAGGEMSAAHWLKYLRDHLNERDPSKRGIAPVGETRCTWAEGLQNQIFPQMQIDDFRRITSSILPGDDTLGELYDGACTRRVYANQSLRVRSVDRKEDGTNMLAALDTQLERSPATITYWSRGLIDANSEVQKDDHVSVITGRRYNPETKTCEYRLRNSWGDSCKGYDPTFKCVDGLSWLSETQVKRLAVTISGYQ